MKNPIHRKRLLLILRRIEEDVLEPVDKWDLHQVGYFFCPLFFLARFFRFFRLKKPVELLYLIIKLDLGDVGILLAFHIEIRAGLQVVIPVAVDDFFLPASIFKYIILYNKYI